MRFLVKARMDTEKANELARQGKLGETAGAIIAEQKPEAVYFALDQGKRTVFLFLNMDDPSELPGIAEPWFLAFNAEVESQPAMTPEDLQKAGPGIEAAVKNFG